MKIVYSLHALERIRQRGINKKLIVLCIQKPDRSEELEGAYRSIKKIDNKVIVVIYRKKDDKVVVITAYISSKVQKYLS